MLWAKKSAKGSFFEKNALNICIFQKIVVPLHPISRARADFGKKSACKMDNRE
jgi:hypothetical protein